MPELPPAVVVGLGSVVGLQTARLLAARGVPVVGIAGDRRHHAARTRVCRRVVEAPVHGPGLLAALERLGPGLGGAVLVPCTDQSVLDVSDARGRLAPWYRTCLPAPEVVRRLTDKAAFAEHAQRAGLPVPPTAVLRSRADAERAAAELPFPAVLKPAVKTPTWTAATGVKALDLPDAGALLRAWDRLGEHADALVAQAFVPGGSDRLWTCNACFGGDGRPLATFVTRKVRQWPPRLGIASFAVEEPDDEVVAATLALFGSLPYRGLGYLELKRDPAGRLLMIEANIGRPTGRSATAEAGGVELLLTAYREAAGLPPLPAAQRVQTGRGAAWVDVRRDAMAAALLWRAGELTLAGWLRSLRRPLVHSVWSRTDPLPFAVELGRSLRRAGRRALPRAPGSRGAALPRRGRAAGR